MMRALFLWIVLVALPSCAMLQGEGRRDGAAAIAPGLTIRLPQPVGLARPVRADQLVTLRRGEDAFTFQGRIEAGPGRVSLVGLDMLGRRVLTVHWADDGLHAEKAPWLPDGFDVANMMADIVLIFWPEGEVRRTLAAAGASLHAGPRRRVVSVDGRDVVRVDYDPSGREPWSGQAHYVNIAWGYRIDIRSVEAAP